MTIFLRDASQCGVFDFCLLLFLWSVRQAERKQYACDYDDCVKFVKLKIADRRERQK